MHTNHFSIRVLTKKPITNGRVTWWLLLLQEFIITIIDRPAKENLVAYFHSHIQHDNDIKPIDDTFPDEHLFAVSFQTPWFANIANYLAAGKVQHHLAPYEKCCIIVQSSNYSWVDNDLFHTGPDLIIRICVRDDEMIDNLQACHDGPCAGHFYDRHT